jgi:catechol 2,3-dioxygenase-like lactoylglutathione lyase family enzyme
MDARSFKGPAAYVGDLGRSRPFYEGLLGLAVRREMFANGTVIAVAYTCGLSIWQFAHATAVIFGPDAPVPATVPSGGWEASFETPEFAAIHARLLAAGTPFAHPLRELPWGQRGFRANDPDGHIIDIAETHGAAVRRMVAEGMSRAAVAARISVTPAQIDAYLAGED